MKTKAFFFVALLATVLSSCSSTVFYQLYKATPTSGVSDKGKNLLYEDDRCTVTYNFWSDSGNPGFTFYNKTNENLYIDLSDSYFIMNGIAYDYYKNRITTTGSGESVSAAGRTGVVIPVTTIFGPLAGIQSIQKGVSHSQSQSISITEPKIICIPSKTAKMIAEYSINDMRIKNCSLLKYPGKKQVRPVSFNASDSPFIFSNRITYTDASGTKYKFENSFYVSQISNHPASEFISRTHSKECDESVTNETYNYAGPDRFYITYLKGSDVSKY